MSYHPQPKVSLVGAGPGDPDLITVKGWKALQNADVVLYDALVSPELLEEAPAKAVKIYVGKRAGKHSYKQEEINRLMLECAMKYGHVVRLKGGDPFVFGRGHEEMTYLAGYGVPVYVIPGISSSISLPALQGVPVTRRHLNESFWVLTGTTRAGTLSSDVSLAVKSSATVIILMGIRRLREIAELYRSEGRADIPAMVIQNGSLPEERSAVGTIGELPALAEAQQIGTPGIIVIGETVRLHRDFSKTLFQLNSLHQELVAQ
ncbi:uroporphyrinogen-III C-methyltransferase [Flavilitoribacter nigricans]|uniref:uroporphyrinogen-III C-methyltransferase n=1 Tax=Flavilitoribacter nigricans (strain ATCC 23147 / DSM 23189 / NBRC 102662 / NCIMB 1420 / SS-2) TaxID=1122177 RepID=A0A2D0NCK3_FLAN2|nr:uroporphyrinogen-III C-methyltransferase [Flavilitoribacter nigricans]PHN06225.1 uroporphyrinogen-III C-methyltransferase [Flavilitoribacter nigricans DSM 23189 = NBRC 102662]